MASTKEYLDFVLEQLSELDAELELPYEDSSCNGHFIKTGKE